MPLGGVKEEKEEEEGDFHLSLTRKGEPKKREKTRTHVANNG